MEHWNQKVSANRGKTWKSKLLSGRLEVQMNPTKLRLARIKKGLTQTDVAKTLGLTYATYGAIEAGRRAVKNDRANKITGLLGVALKHAFTENKAGKLVAKKG